MDEPDGDGESMIDEDDDTEMWAGSATEPVFGFAVGDTVLMNVHPRSRCEGCPCVLHNPSDHHMREWPTHFRSDKGQMERVCEHGVGHPDPDCTAWHVSEGRDGMGVHGCDGCCRGPA